MIEIEEGADLIQEEGEEPFQGADLGTKERDTVILNQEEDGEVIQEGAEIIQGGGERVIHYKKDQGIGRKEEIILTKYI